VPDWSVRLTSEDVLCISAMVGVDGWAKHKIEKQNQSAFSATKKQLFH
jgi:hypothetical protein